MLDKLLENNKKWISEKLQIKENYFENLSKGQTPEILYIGCSDSRVTAEDMLGLQPGEAFIHRNVANIVSNSDLNVMTAINYAVVHLKVNHIIVCGHYGCGGIKAAMQHSDLGILNPWLRNIRDIYRLHRTELNSISDEITRYNRLVELNISEQCINVIKTAEVQRRYVDEGYPQVHGWVFNMASGLVVDLKINLKSELAKIQEIYNLTEEKWF